MKVSVEIVACIACTITILLNNPVSGIRENNKLKYNTKTWDFDFYPNPYSPFIHSLRTEISVENVCDIPVTPKSPKPNDAFVLVNLINTNQRSITLAFRKTNVYYVGYEDTLNGALRANFVKDDFKELEKSNLFAGARLRSELPHEGGYGDLERVGKIERAKLALGVGSLSSFIDTIYGADYNGKNKPKDIGQNLARFALTAIQMIAEATRFKYIEDKVSVLGPYDTFKPDDVFLKLENSWEAFSKLIHESSPGCKPVKSPNFPMWDDIKPQVGILKFKDSKLNVGPLLVEGIFGNRTTGDGGGGGDIVV